MSGIQVPPADALKAIADALGVSSDAMLSDDVIAIKNKEFLKRFDSIQDMDGEDKAILLSFLTLPLEILMQKKFTHKYMISATEFWDWFEDNNARFFFLNQIDDDEEKERILSEFHSKLNEYSKGLYFEIGGLPDEDQDLIISAGGDINYFEDVKVLVSSAKKIENWNIIAFKPAVNEGFKFNYKNIHLSSEDIWFISEESKNGYLNITLLFKDFEKTYESEYRSASYIILETVLGEQLYNEKIYSVFVDGLSEDEEVYQLKELYDIVEKGY